MNIRECRRYSFHLALLAALLIAALASSGCKNAAATKAEHLQRGEALLKEKKFQEASIEYRNVIQLDDRDAAGHWGLARAYEGLQRFQEAFDEMKRTADLDPKNLDVRVRLGNYYLMGKGIAEAEQLAKDVLQKDPNNIEGHILMGSILFAQDKRAEALEHMTHAVELDPKRIESYLSLARFYISSKDMGKAEDTFKRAIGVNDASALAHMEYGKFLAQIDRRDAAETELKKATEVEPQNRDARFVLASFYLVNNQNEKAEDAYKALAELDKDSPEGRAVLADFYSSVGRLDDAVNIYQEILAKSPDYARGRYRLGEIMLMRGDMQGAEQQVSEVLKKNEHDMQALMLRARIRSQTGKNEDVKAAIEDLKEVLKQEPNSRAGLYFMAEANFRIGQTEQARAFAGDLERYYPDYLPAKLMQVQINLAAGDPKTALRLSNEFMDRLAKAAPDRETSPQMLAELKSKALTSRASAELQLQDTKAARADFTAARDAAPNDPGSYINLAAVALGEQKPDEAISLYERALAIDSSNYDALNGLINIYARQKKTEQAHARVDQALAAQPNKPWLHYLKAQVYGYDKNAQGAESELRRTLELDVNYLAAYSALGALFVNLNQQERAINEYHKIIEHKPDDASAYTLIGMLEDSRGNRDAAVENYRKAVELDQNNAIAANNLAWSYASYGKGNLDEAVRLAQGVVQKYPEMPGFADTLGWVYYQKGLYAAAVEQFQKAVAKDDAIARQANVTPSPGYHYRLGLALSKKGDRQGARRELEQSLRLGEGKNFAEADDARKALATL
jgi:tetratricopeptide (TPR) repeat protein